MGKVLIQFQPDVMIFDSMTFDNTSDVQRIIVKGFDVGDDEQDHMMSWVFNTDTVPMLKLQQLKSGDLLFWHGGALIPVPFDKHQENVKVFRKVLNK